MTRHLADIAVGKIRVPDDTIREADEASVEMLAGMMAEEGQAQPIEVGVEGDGFVLVFGLHRLLASRKNKWKTIEALVDAEDGDPAARRRRAIHENLGRNELIKLDRATHIAELHRLLQEASPRRKRGGDRRSADFKGQTPAFGLTEAVAARVGLSESVIKEAVAITHGLSPAIRRRIIKVPALAKLADSQIDLVRLAREPDQRQTKILNMIEGGDTISVADAIAILDGERKPTETERSWSLAQNAIARLQGANRDRFFATFEAEFLTWRKQKGRKSS